VNYWISNKEDQDQTRYSSGSTYSSSTKPHTPIIVSKGPVVNKHVAIKIADNFLTTDTSLNSEMYSRILSPVSMKTTQGDDFVTTTTDYTLPTLPTELDSGRNKSQNNPVKTIMQSTISSLPPNVQKDLDLVEQVNNGMTLKPSYKNFAAQKIQQLQKENIPSGPNYFISVTSPTGEKKNLLEGTLKARDNNVQPQLQQTFPKQFKSTLANNKFGTIYEVDEFYSTDRTLKESDRMNTGDKENVAVGEEN